MSPVSRRAALAAALAGTAAGVVPSAALARAPEKASRAPVAASAAVASAPGAQPPATMWVHRQDVNDARFFRAGLGGPLTARKTGTAGPETYEVSDAHGPLATLTKGARTVTVHGPRRTFTEQKKAFTDRFDRGVSGWGTSPGGGRWATPDTGRAEFRVEGGNGTVVLREDGFSQFATLSDSVGDVDVCAVLTLDGVPAGDAVSAAVCCAYTGDDRHYRARLSFLTTGEVRLILEMAAGGTTTLLGGPVQVGSGFRPGDRWRLRLERTGTSLRCRAWRDGQSEPATWQAAGTDGTLGAGGTGIRVLANKGGTALPMKVLVGEFTVAGRRPEPPEVTHDLWVRLLDTPFDGTLAPALERRLRDWAGDTSPDALGYAAMFLPHAAGAVDPVIGTRVLGEAGYGPFNTTTGDGTREIGADFWEYMGLDTWNFPNGEAPAQPENTGSQKRWAGFLDCSGYVRMVYGHHMGIPMVNYRDFDGTNLPRESADQAAKGPGVVVAGLTAEGVPGQAPPPLDGLRVGDLVYFDAYDSAGDDEGAGDDRGTIDHVGIYLGRDQDGRRRFASSRKTPDGPTMADLGALSVLDAGTELYSRSLRVIRRF
ncbi:NlpC/P60 family protein [Streptomyces sp. NPDC059017]|uniref:NlpC/P60 family protein n=1 Tax=unclassified Streptomyces TaxID=2593676 RepID=UPI0036B5D877